MENEGLKPTGLPPITTLSFRYAKTMPECPHEYAERSPAEESSPVYGFYA